MATHQNDDHVRAQGTTTTPNISEAGNKGDIECTADQHSTLRDTIDDDIQFPQSAEEELLSSVAPQLTAVLADGHPEYNIPHCLIGQYATDTFFKPIAEQPDRFKQFYRHDGLIFLSNSDRRILCVPDVSIGTHKVRELIISQAHSILAHLGSQKTLYYLKDNVWWPGLTADVKAYCESCRTCATSKSNTTAPYGLLHPLAVPDRPWDVIGVDFVGPLPESRTRTGIFDMICVIIDHFTYMVHLVPSVQTYRARDIAELMFDTVYKLHGIPRKIVSDRDSLFTGQFWEQLNKLVGVDLRRSSAYHPQSDGLTERTNRTLGQMLRQCVSPNQKDWAAKLPAIEFALNSARSDSTGFSPFFLNAGRVPRPMIWDSSSQYPGVRAFAGKMKDALLAAHDALLAARVKMTRQANRHRRPTPFVVGDLAYLSTKNLSLPKGRSRKLFPKYIGPFRILQDFGNSTFRLELPADLRRRGVQSSFHASLLRVHHPNDDRRFPGRQLDQLSGFNDHPHEWAVDRIRTHHGAGRTALFELQWKSGDVSWAPYDDVAHLEALGTYLELLGVTGISKLTTGTAPPPADPELRVSAAGFDKSYQSAYKKNADSPTQLQLSSLTMPRQWTLAQLRAFATYAEQLHAAGNSGPAAPSPAPEHYDAWAASTQQSISDLPPVPTSQPTTHVAEHVTNTVSADAARTQTMADEWVELGRIAINDLVKNRRTQQDTQRGGQSSRGRHSHRGRSHALYRPRGGQLNHQANVNRAAFYRRQRQFDDLPAYDDHRRRSRSPARRIHRRADHSPPRRGRARTPVRADSVSSAESISSDDDGHDDVVYPKATAVTPSPVPQDVGTTSTNVAPGAPVVQSSDTNVPLVAPTVTQPPAHTVGELPDVFIGPSSSTITSAGVTFEEFLRGLTSGGQGNSTNALTIPPSATASIPAPTPAADNLSQLPFHPSADDLLTPPAAFNLDGDIEMDTGGDTGRQTGMSPSNGAIPPF